MRRSGQLLATSPGHLPALTKLLPIPPRRGYRFSPAGLTLAKQTIANFIEKASRLYEQKRRAVSAATALEMYVRRWLMWAMGGIGGDHRPQNNVMSACRAFTLL